MERPIFQGALEKKKHAHAQKQEPHKRAYLSEKYCGQRN